MSEIVCGTGGWSGPKPGDPDNNVVLRAFPVFGGVNVVWTFPGVNPAAVAHTRVYRSTSGADADPPLLAVVGGSSYFDQARAGDYTTYYYWIEIISVHGTVGPRIGPADAAPLQPIAQIIEELTGKIDAGHLAQSLKEPIERVGDLNRDLESEIQARLESIGTLQDVIDAVQAKGDETRTLLSQEVRQRSDANSAIVSKINTIATTADANGAALRTEQTVRADETAALAEDITQLSAKTTNALNTLTADLVEERKTRIAEDEAYARTTNAAITNLNDKVVAGFLDEKTARVTADQAITKNINSLSSRVDDAMAGINEETETRASETSALSSAVQSLTARLNSAPIWSSGFEPGADFDRWKAGSPAATLLAETSSYSGGQAGIIRYKGSEAPKASGSTGGVYAKVSESIAMNFAGKRVRVTGYAKAPLAYRASEFAVAYSTADVGNSGWHRFPVKSDWTQFDFLYDVPQASSKGGDYVGIWGDTSNAGNGVMVDMLNIQPATTEEDLPAITAAVQTEANARVSADKALADKIDTVSTSIGDDVAAVQTTMDATVERIDGDLTSLGALYTAKVQANGLIGGFGVYNDGTSVEAGFDVDRFWIGRTNSAKRKPFIIADGNTYIDSAMIRDGTIQEGQLGPITIGKITQPNGAPLTTVAGKIRADAIDVDNLSVAEAATFTGIAQSNNYSSGAYGWIIHPDGNVEFNQGVFNGQVEFRNVSGAGRLASKDSLAYSELSGSKPPTNADRTASNTAYDTSRVAGESAEVVRQGAGHGYTASGWVRPGSTLIDGNKIYTGDAYVDTLQIKGQAVTIPASYFAADSIQLNDSWTTVASLTMNPMGAPLHITASVTVDAEYYSSYNHGNTSASIVLYGRFLSYRGNLDIGTVAADSDRNRNSSSRASVSGAYSYSWDLPASWGNNNIRFQLRLSYNDRGFASIRSLYAIATRR